MTKQELEEKHKRNMRIITIILGLIMLFSTLGYALMNVEETPSSSNEKINYKGIEFLKANGAWTFTYAGENYATTFNPLEVNSVNSTVSVSIQKSLSDFYNKPLYFGITSIEDVASNGNYELLRGLQKIISKNQLSCIDNSCSEDYPIKNCSESNVIIFKNSDTNRSYVTENNDCIIINYAEGEEVKSADALLFKLLGI